MSCFSVKELSNDTYKQQEENLMLKHSFLRFVDVMEVSIPFD